VHWADPFLGATLVGPVVKGIQQNNVVVSMRMQHEAAVICMRHGAAVGFPFASQMARWLGTTQANAKHFVENNQETNRGAVDEIVDERTRFEMYYPPFAAASKAGLGSIMCS
jgi:beta-glucosidase-like glycosyl hydrolase